MENNNSFLLALGFWHCFLRDICPHVNHIQKVVVEMSNHASMSCLKELLLHATAGSHKVLFCCCMASLHNRLSIHKYYRSNWRTLVYLYLKDNIVHINSRHPFALNPYHTILLPIIIKVDEHVVGQTISTCRWNKTLNTNPTINITSVKFSLLVTHTKRHILCRHYKYEIIAGKNQSLGR